MLMKNPVVHAMTQSVLSFLTQLIPSLLLLTLPCVAQFSGGVQGTVQDAQGAAVANATVTLINTDLGVTQTALSNANGVYRFPSLAPGNYRVSATAGGFSPAGVDFVLRTDENRDVPLTLQVGSVSSKVEVTAQAPLIDASDSREQLTIDQAQFADLPLPALNPISFVSLTPGVTGLGVGLQTDFQTYAPDVSANGRGANGNLYVLDGLDINMTANYGSPSNIPNSDMLSEMSVQTNTYAVDFGRVSSIQTVMTSKSGSTTFHGSAFERYQYQGLNARGEFGVPQPNRVAPYHSNEMSFQLGGPISKKHQFFFFFNWQPYLASVSSGNVQLSFEDPAFTSFASQATPNSPELPLLTKYLPSRATTTGVLQTALDVFGATDVVHNTGCGTPSTDNIPCATPIFDSGIYNASAPFHGRQFFTRIDKYFSKDRVYATLFWRNFGCTNVIVCFPTLVGVSPTIRTDSDYTNKFAGKAFQGNETHSFSPRTLNEASVGYDYIIGFEGITGDHTIPVVGVNGLGVGWGNGFAGGPYAEHQVHWRDVLTHIVGSHSVKFGYEGSWGTDLADFAADHGIPNFQFNNMIDLINNNPVYETGLSYDAVSGQRRPGSYNYAMTTHGAFAEDTWKATRRLTVNYGIRYDNYGNAYPIDGSYFKTNLSNFILGSGSTFDQRVASGVMKVRSHALDHDVNWVFSPRVGLSFDPTGSGQWVIRGGFGVYRDIVGLTTQEGVLNSNPPGFVIPTFFNNGSTSAPIFAFGTDNKYPFGYPYPQFGGQPLNSAGGFAGGQFRVGGVDLNIKSPYSSVWSASVERQVARGLTASAGYVGQHSQDLIIGSGAQGGGTFDADVNVFSGDLIQHPGCTPTPGQIVTCKGVQTRLNPNFGEVDFAYNTAAARSNYQALILAVKGRFARKGFITASYTRSESKDNLGSLYYPVEYSIDRWYGPSPFDVPNRVTVGVDYTFPDFNHGKGIVGRVISGWQLSGVSIMQSGYPFTVQTGAAFDAESVDGGPLQFMPDSGNFRADGDNAANGVYSYPNVSSYHTSHSRSAYRNGLFPHCSGTNLDNCGPFSFPTMGQEGNERTNQFRNPGFAQTDITMMKSAKLSERVNLQLRCDFFNVFNRVNLGPVDADASHGAVFGTSTSTQSPRVGQLGVKIEF
jgi:hypothetical protein